MPEFDDLIREIKTCTLCGLSAQRTNAVPGGGPSSADIMFIGEGRGYYEDRDGHPFVGPAGKVLDEMLSSAGLRRSDVYITNMVKCRPPGNRDPLPEELSACQPYLDRQLEMIAPKVLVTLGRFSFTRFFPGEMISRGRGKPRTWRHLTIYPTYHPAAALHNPKLRSLIEGDFAKLPILIKSLGQQPVQVVSTPAKQLNLFE